MALSPLSLALPLSFFLGVPALGFLGLSLAGFLSRRGQRGDDARRQVFRSVNAFAMMAAALALFSGVFAFFRAPTVPALADLWFGSSSTSVLVPFLPIAAVPLMLFLVLAHKQEVRRFGAVPTGPAIPMSDEEKAARKRIAFYSRLPHLICSAVLFAAIIAVPRRSPLYPFVHPWEVFVPLVGGGLIARLFQKRLDRFTQKTIEDLTWRARQLGQTLGVRMPDVFVEDSSRAAHLAFASHQGHHITLSRKLQETFTPAETDFVLAHHLACMKRRTGQSSRQWLIRLACLPIIVPVIVPVTLVLLPRNLPGVPSLTAFILSPWFFPVLVAFPLIGVVFLVGAVIGSGNQQMKQDTDADRNALEVTGNLAAAESALDKMVADDMPMLTQISKVSASDPAQMRELTRAGGTLLRRLELHKAAQALGLAPGTETGRNATG